MGNKTNDRDMSKQKHQFIKKLYYMVVRHHLVHNRYTIYVPYSYCDSFKLGDLSEKSIFLFFIRLFLWRLTVCYHALEWYSLWRILGESVLLFCSLLHCITVLLNPGLCSSFKSSEKPASHSTSPLLVLHHLFPSPQK